MSIKANIEHVNELKAKAAEKSGRTVEATWYWIA